MSGRMVGTENLLDSCEDRLNSQNSNNHQLRKMKLSSLLLGVERADGTQLETKPSCLTFLHRFSLLQLFVQRNLNFGNTTKSFKISSFALFSWSWAWFQAHSTLQHVFDCPALKTCEISPNNSNYSQRYKDFPNFNWWLFEFSLFILASQLSRRFWLHSPTHILELMNRPS